MERTYHRAAILVSMAAMAGCGGAGASMAAALSWPSPESGQVIADRTNAQPAAPAPLPVASRGRLVDGDYTGPAVDAYYGLVQVKVSIHGGRLVSVDVLRYPADRRTSRYINSQALPMLKSEVIQAQSAQVYGVSGATLTSRAYLRSVEAALSKAGA